MMAMDDEETIENILGFDVTETDSEEEGDVDEVTAANTAANAANENQPGEAPPKRRIVRKSIPKLDSNVLLSENGLRKLQTLLSKTSFKRGKGHERENLNRLINVYQLWGHNLYPRLKFKSIIERTEKLCSEKRLKIAYTTWKEANKYKQRYEDDDYNASGIIRDDHPNEDGPSGFNMDVDIFKPFSVPTDSTATASTSTTTTTAATTSTTTTTTVPNETINHLMLNSDQASTSTTNIPLSRLSHPLTEEEQAFIKDNRERALQKLRQKKEEQRRLRELKEKQEQEQEQQQQLQ